MNITHTPANQNGTDSNSDTTPQIKELSESSKFNLKFMWNVNRISIAIFVLAILAKLIYKYFIV